MKDLWDREFYSRFPLQKHIVEQHKQFGNKCKVCKKMFDKSTPKNGNCRAGEENQILISKMTGESGLKIKDEYVKYQETVVQENI